MEQCVLRWKMDENTARVLNKLTDKGAFWTIAAMFIRILPAIIAAAFGANGVSALLDFISR